MILGDGTYMNFTAATGISRKTPTTDHKEEEIEGSGDGNVTGDGDTEGGDDGDQDFDMTSMSM